MTINLQHASEENLSFILNKLADMLGVANQIIFDEKYYSLDQYDELKFLYDHVHHSGKLSSSEVEAIIDELSVIRQK